MKRQLLATTLSVVLSSSLFAGAIPTNQSTNAWYSDAQAELQAKIAYVKKTSKAKNVILFIGDGMGISTVTASRILEGQDRNETGEENMLSFDKFPYTALIKTYNTNSQTPDSAGTMTAMTTGVKTKIGVIGVSDASLRANCLSSIGTEVPTIMELAEDMNKSTGVISTARLTHATPAATYAHSSERNWEHNTGSDTDGCKDIATQFIEFSHGDGIDVALGGGRREFMPNDADAVEGKSGKRTDGRDLRAEWKVKYPEGVYVENQAEFDDVNASSTTKLFGLFNYSHMQYEADRANDVDGEPSLTQMTEKAINILSKDEDGFVLMVEAGRIDHAHHAGNAAGALSDTIEMAKAVAMADALTSDEDTLILVTADHSHVFTIAGYPKRGNPILGKVRAAGKTSDDLAADGKPYTTLGYTNGLGFHDLGTETNSDASYGIGLGSPRADVNLTNIDTTTPGFHQEAVIPRGSETHAGEDIALYAKGPGAHYAQGVLEQNVIFHIINKAADLGGTAQK